MDSDLLQGLDDLAWVYPIPDDLVHPQQVVGGHCPENSDCGQQLEEEGYYGVHVRGGFGSVLECLLLHRSRYRG